MKFLSKFPNIKYVQVRRISTDTRYEELKPDIYVYEKLYRFISQFSMFPRIADFYDAQRFIINGIESVFWRTVETSVNSINYFTDGTIANCYFVIEGYLKNYKGKGNQMSEEFYNWLDKIIKEKNKNGFQQKNDRK